MNEACWHDGSHVWVSTCWIDWTGVISRHVSDTVLRAELLSTQGARLFTPVWESFSHLAHWTVWRLWHVVVARCDKLSTGCQYYSLDWFWIWIVRELQLNWVGSNNMSLLYDWVMIKFWLELYNLSIVTWCGPGYKDLHVCIYIVEWSFFCHYHCVLSSLEFFL